MIVRPAPIGKGRLAIVAGWGQLPLYLAEAAREAGEETARPMLMEWLATLSD